MLLNLKIDPEFRDKIPAMPQEDFEGLKTDILRDGYVRDPLVVWKEENILLDGHHRWIVIQENVDLLGDKFKVDYKSFPDRWACIAWICANQLHKHNMTEMQKMKLIQEEHDSILKSVGAPVANKNASKQFGKNVQVVLDGREFVKNPDTRNETRPIIAKEHGMTEREVRTAIEVGRGIDRASEVDPNFKREVLSGEVHATKSSLSAIRKMKSDDEVKEAIEEIRKPKPKPVIATQRPKPKKSEEDLRRKEVATKMIEAQYDKERVVEYTLDDLLSEIKRNGEDYTSSLRMTLTLRSTILIPENRESVANEIEAIITEIKKIKELVK